MKTIQFIFVLLILSYFVTSCDNGEETNTDVQSNENRVSSEMTSLEEEAANIDIKQDSLASGKSLYYSKEDGSSIQVEIFLNDSNEVIKWSEKFTTPEFSSIQSNYFYMMRGKKFLTREFFEEKTETGSQFVERVTYYDKNEKPVLTRRRVAPFEELLEQESYKTVATRDCSLKRAIKVINQKDEYITTFQGFVKEGPLYYLIVGENKPDGYTSSLMVQHENADLNKLLRDEVGMVGTPLKVDFQSAMSDHNYEFQVLLGVSILK